MTLPEGAALIEWFEVPPDADEAFLADWRRERGSAGTLYRALRDDAPVRYVGITQGRGYVVVHEDGEPDGASGTIQITTFAVPAPDDDEFLAAWRRVREIAAARRGYLGTRLYRGAADPSYVAVARWSSPLMIARTAAQQEFRQATGELPFRSEPVLYLVANGRAR